MVFRVDLDSFRGPVDLLLYLVRKHEVDVTEVSLAAITQAYLDSLEVLKEIDINLVGDFLEVASLLVEIKARNVLPRNEFEESEGLADPREDLVQRLLMYKEFRDAASLLEDQSRQWQQRFSRLSDDMPPRKVDMANQPIKEVELWDLVSAFGRMMRDNRPPPEDKIFLDETPLHVYMQQIHQRIAERGEVVFSEMFEVGMHKTAMVGIFLAVLELTRHHNIIAEQSDFHGEIRMVPGDGFQKALELSNIDTYEPTPDTEKGDPASLVD